MADKCNSCRYNTNDFVCHPHCSGCDGKSKFVLAITGFPPINDEEYDDLAKQIENFSESIGITYE